ncbi:MAG: oligopeptide transporter, OPT family [Proteobacteria bacterium]|nr:oligopeptide transporter, OPT family [Pseudomonadota bacterium]
MNHETTPFISAEQNLVEMSIKVIVLSVILSAVLAIANSYLALKIGILTSASIPAAVISMGILRFFKNANILENNLVQTAASAGEAVAGGIVYTIPALIIIGYWHHFDYFTNFFIALAGGVLGVLFCIPLRRVLVHEKTLLFPEGRAIAEVLKISSTKLLGLKEIFLGGSIAALIELMQTGFKLIANSWQVWFSNEKFLFGYGVGFSPAMIGAGYLIGFRLGLSIFIGSILGWLIAVPAVSAFYPVLNTTSSSTDLVMTLWSQKIRYIGIGAMLIAGIATFLSLLKPFYLSLKTSFQAMKISRNHFYQLPRTDRDLPIHYVFSLIIVLALALGYFFYTYFPISSLNLSAGWNGTVIIGSLLYILFIGFIFSAITGYFSGMVGVSATPGSAIIIAGMLMAALVLFSLLKHLSGVLTHEQVLAAEAITIIIGSVITGAAAIANDNMQDLKVGQILGATPWKQQLMLLLGVIISALVIPPIMQILFDVYGIAGVFPRPGMDPAQTLAAPPAALMAAITQTVFQQNLPWLMVGIGAFIILIFIGINKILRRKDHFAISILGVAIGIYLPLASSIPLCIGGAMAFISQRRLPQKLEGESVYQKHRGILLACGLVAGAALMDVILAVPFAFARNPDILSLAPSHWSTQAALLAVLVTILLGAWFYRLVAIQKSKAQLG